MHPSISALVINEICSKWVEWNGALDFVAFFKVLSAFWRIKLNMSNVEPPWIPFSQDLMKEKEVAKRFTKRKLENFYVTLPYKINIFHYEY